MTMQQEIKSLKKDISKLQNMLADQFEETASNGHSKTVFTKEEIARMANKAGKNVRGYLNDKQQQLGDAKQACESTIKERPFTSAAVAFAGGMLLTTLLKKK